MDLEHGLLHLLVGLREGEDLLELGFLRMDGLLLQPRQNPLRLRHLHLQLPILKLYLSQSRDLLLQHTHRVISTYVNQVLGVVTSVMRSATFLSRHIRHGVAVWVWDMERDTFRIIVVFKLHHGRGLGVEFNRLNDIVVLSVYHYQAAKA